MRAVTEVPRPGSVSSSTLPPWASTTPRLDARRHLVEGRGKLADLVVTAEPDAGRELARPE